MNQETDLFAYMMAAEKVSNLIFTMENTLEFLGEYKIQPDDEVKKCLSPLLDQFNKWLKQN